MKNIDLIIFDLDGTLVDSRKDIVNAVNFTLKNMHLKEKGFEELISYIGWGVEDLIKKALGNEKIDFFERAMSLFEEHYRKHAVEKTTLYPNVLKVLERFKNKRKVIVTNRKYEFAIITLKKLGIYYYFEDIVGGDNLGCMKPSSCPLDSTVEKFNTEKAKTIIVGDMYIDILAGKRAGILTCAVTYGIGSIEDIVKAKPDFIIDDIIKLKEIIK